MLPSQVKTSIEGTHRLFDHKSKKYIRITRRAESRDDVVDATLDGSAASYFEVKIDPSSTQFGAVTAVFISHLGENGVRRYLSYCWDEHASHYRAVLSTTPFSWAVRAQDAGKSLKFSIAWSTYFQLTVLDSKVVQVYDKGNNYQDWSFVA
ncbi:hypothetical protein CVT26_003521 [Gymnopilus dilepis]|uniref:Uncharacterized protein n=1 Tax=Gymnopilus dilepis TaxID=231916 RepID=A0A409WR31_9AGAR|nr:hypothetical protein CVT26_003521 [Gymnopilus dilepis]